MKNNLFDPAILFEAKVDSNFIKEVMEISYDF